MLISHSSPPFFFHASHSRSKTLPLFILRLFPHLPLFHLLSPSSTPFSLAFFTSLTSCHLFLAPFIFVPTFLLFLYTHPSLTLFLCSIFLLIFLISSSSPRSLSQFCLPPSLVFCLPFSSCTLSHPFFLTSTSHSPTPLLLLPFTDCFLTDLSLLFSPTLSSFSSSLLVALHS